MSEIQIIVPRRDSGYVSSEMYELSRRLGEMNPEQQSHGFLGGEWGYGQDYRSDVFSMFPFYWGECECGWDQINEALEGLAHDPDCYQTELRARFATEGLGYDEDTWKPRSPAMSYEDRNVRERAIYRELTGKYGLPMPGCAVHCTCTRRERWRAQFDAMKLGPHGHAETCLLVRPNFTFGDLSLNWYKYIGRDMEPSRPVSRGEWRRIFAACNAHLDAIGAPK